MNLDQIFPLIVPRSYYSEGAWELPHQQFYNKEFLLAWVFFDGPGGMTYLTKNDFAGLNKNDIGWQQKSFENLRHSMTEKESFFTHQATASDGKKVKFLVFMHSDGIGSSRILLSNELNKIFPNGYHVALPDRSVGIVAPSGTSEAELKELKQTVSGMHRKATTPMSGQLYTPENFSLPVDWLKPKDEEFSKVLIDHTRESMG